jgi:hypothetical protein
MISQISLPQKWGVGGFAEHANVPFGFGDNGDIVNVVQIIHVYLVSFSISISTTINGTRKPFIRILSDKNYGDFSTIHTLSSISNFVLFLIRFLDFMVVLTIKHKKVV